MPCVKFIVFYEYMKCNKTIKINILLAGCFVIRPSEASSSQMVTLFLHRPTVYF